MRQRNSVVSAAAAVWVERKVNLPVATVKGVDMAISDLEMALSLDDFSKTILEPAMAQLAAQIEYDAINALYKYVPNYVGTVSTQLDYKKFQQAGQVLTENLAPSSQRCFMVCSVNINSINY